MKDEKTIIQKMLLDLINAEKTCVDLQKSYSSTTSESERVRYNELYNNTNKQYLKNKRKLIAKVPVSLHDLIVEMLKLLNNKEECLKMLGIKELNEDQFGKDVFLTEDSMNNSIVYNAYKNVLSKLTI